MQLINTSTLAKHYRTTTGDIEKRLTDAGLTPVKTVTMQSGRRFMVWDQAAAMKAMDDYKASRMELMRAREMQRQELMTHAPAVPVRAPSPAQAAGPVANATVDVPPDYLEGIIQNILGAIKESQETIQSEFTDSMTQLVANTGKIDALVEGQNKLEREFVNRNANQVTIREQQARIMEMMERLMARLERIEAQTGVKL